MRGRLITLSLVAATAALSVPIPAAATPPGPRDVIVQLFQWNWASVARECRDFLGPRGYGGVQISPPQEHVVLPGSGYPWWQDYQPASYRLDNTRRGDRAAFANMINTCHAAGVKVYADAVINHMAGGGSGGPGSAGSSYSHYDYPGIYQTQDFHHCGRNGTDDIVNYGDRYEVQNCELVDLADLATESDYVRGRIAGYLNALISLGVDGFRLDASKHMPAADIAAIKARLSAPVYLYQEVIFGAGEPITPEEYTGSGDVLEFRYGRDIAKIFNTERLAFLRTFGSPLPGDKAVVFTDNHDTQRGGGVLTFRDNGRYALANAFMLAWPYGSPKVMSSYEYTSNDQGPPADGSGRTTDTTCFANRWRCEHRWQVIANMVAFHNSVRGTPVVHWWDNGNDTIAFGRGDRGYLILNDESVPVTGRWFATALPPGVYCDVVHGDFTQGNCTGPRYTVNSGGWFQADIAAHDGLALHAGARIS
ncbi:MAG TPA: alpha-amylase family protein [Actinophytocola sp.]|uniref:alpha-amylase n=1 Tax=Actinophytocola sp. TaxID=1872138 RepID=UPI002DDD2ED9|nr:alpha-amylase family protein [Actinophytocola sp.]HEV2780112.1 alpha-amylase family protein [Actinophytocola sp.]